MKSIHEQIKCVSREIGLRKSVYPKLIEAGKMDPFEADREISAMQAVLHTLTEVRDKDQGKLF